MHGRTKKNPLLLSVFTCVSELCLLNAGIDKLTEKSQVSEDGTMRSLEPESLQSSPEGNPSSVVSDGEPWSGVRLDNLVCREGLGCDMN